MFVRRPGCRWEGRTDASRRICFAVRLPHVYAEIVACDPQTFLLTTVLCFSSSIVHLDLKRESLFSRVCTISVEHLAAGQIPIFSICRSRYMQQLAAGCSVYGSCWDIGRVMPHPARCCFSFQHKSWWIHAIRSSPQKRKGNHRASSAIKRAHAASLKAKQSETKQNKTVVNKLRDFFFFQTFSSSTAVCIAPPTRALRSLSQTSRTWPCRQHLFVDTPTDNNRLVIRGGLTSCTRRRRDGSREASWSPAATRARGSTSAFAT